MCMIWKFKCRYILFHLLITTPAIETEMAMAVTSASDELLFCEKLV